MDHHHLCIQGIFRGHSWCASLDLKCEIPDFIEIAWMSSVIEDAEGLFIYPVNKAIFY